MATITIPARKGKAVHLAKGQAVQVINTHGSQVIDTWAFAADDLSEFISLEHCRPFWLRLVPQVGDPFLSNRRRHLAVMEADTSPGGHDTLIAACDPTRYRQLGVEGFHDSCQANLHGALSDLGLKAAETPSPINLFMNIPWDAAGKLSWGQPRSKPGDAVTFRALTDLVFVFSACPQDLIPINGALKQPTEAHFCVF